MYQKIFKVNFFDGIYAVLFLTIKHFSLPCNNLARSNVKCKIKVSLVELHNEFPVK